MTKSARTTRPGWAIRLQTAMTTGVIAARRHTVHVLTLEDDGSDDEHGVALPTPAEIAEACAEIQAGWSAAQKLSRRVGVLQNELRTDNPAAVVRRGEWRRFTQ